MSKFRQLFFLAMASFACASWAQADALNVFVSVPPQKYFVEQIGGDHVDVSVMVLPGGNPTTYEPTPKQMAKLGQAELYFRIGVPFENIWMDRLARINPSMTVVDVRQGLALRELEAHHHHDHDEHHEAHTAAHGHEEAQHEEHEEHEETEIHAAGEAKDPHVWTSPQLVKRIAATIKEALSHHDPEHAAEYERNYRHFVQQLDTLDHEIRQLLAERKAHAFMVFHPSWGYFADAYGLEQISIEFEGKEPTAKRLSQLIKQAREERVSIIFVQPQFSRKAAQRIADAIGARLAVLDPLAEDYPANLRQVARSIAQAAP